MRKEKQRNSTASDDDSHNSTSGADLLWNCFVNWADTLERIQRADKTNEKSRI